MPSLINQRLSPVHQAEFPTNAFGQLFSFCILFNKQTFLPGFAAPALRKQDIHHNCNRCLLVFHMETSNGVANGANNLPAEARALYPKRNSPRQIRFSHTKHHESANCSTAVSGAKPAKAAGHACVMTHLKEPLLAEDYTDHCSGRQGQQRVTLLGSLFQQLRIACPLIINLSSINGEHERHEAWLQHRPAGYAWLGATIPAALFEG